MPDPVANLVTLVLAAYLAVGTLFAPLFAWRGTKRIDPAAHAGSWGFRLMILPGAALLWPLMARAWARGDPGLPPLARPELHRRRHLAMWTLTGPVALAALALAVHLQRQSPATPAETAAADPAQASHPAPLKGGPR